MWLGLIEASHGDARDSQPLVQLGVDPATGTPEEFTALIRDEYARWSKVIRTANIEVN